MDDDGNNNDNENGFGAIFYLFLALGFTGLVGFFLVGMGAIGGM